MRKKKILTILLSFALILTMMPILGLTQMAYATDPSEHWSGDQSITDNTVLENGVTLEKGIKLTIAEGKMLTVNDGILSKDGSAYTLTVEGPGKLVVNGAQGNVGIGGHIVVNGGEVEITGGSGYNASESEYPPDNGGSGYLGVEGNVTVNGGSVTVTGGSGGNGGNCMGTGSGGNGGEGGRGVMGNLTVSGGNIIVIGGSGGSGGSGGESGQAGSAGSAVYGYLYGESPVMFEDGEDGSNWSAVSGTSSEKQYVKAEVKYPLWVGGTQVTSANKDDVFNDQKVSYTPATDIDAAVLKLKNYNNNGSVREWEGRSAAIYANENLTIELNGNNTLTNTAAGNRISAIVTDHDLTFKGKGRLAADCPNGGGIVVNKELTIEDGIIEATGYVGISGVQITITAGTVTAIGTRAGIFAYSGLTINGGTVEATASAGDSFGVGVMDGDAIIKGGKVTASGAEMAIVAKGDVKNAIAGTGWTDKAGTQGKADIAINKEGQDLSSYKKVQFPAAPISAKPVLAAKGIVKGRKAVKISWNSVSGAAKYEVYFSRCNANGKKYTPKFKGSTTGNSMKIKKLRKGRCYKFYVVTKDSKGNVISKSLVGHFIAGNVKGKRTNAKSLTLGASSVSLSKGAAYKITAKQKKVRKGKKLLNSGHAPLLRYVSDNPSIATVDGSGNIKAVDAGTCTIYVQTVNGIWKTVAVTVK